MCPSLSMSKQYIYNTVLYYYKNLLTNPHVYRKGRMTSYLRIGMSGEFSPEMVVKKKKKEEELAKEAELKQDRERALEYDQMYNRGELPLPKR